MTLSSKTFAGSRLFVILACGLLSQSWAKDKLKPEELLEKHLASIGTAEARAAVTNRVAKGTVEAVFHRGGHGVPAGESTVVSAGQMMRLEMAFSAHDYPGEILTFDGMHVNVGEITPGHRSRLESFVSTNGTIMSEGLLGGTISTAWPLLDLAKREGKLEYNGLKKQDGKNLLEMRYRPKKAGTDVQVFLYFDPETFRHVRTRYKYAISSSLAPSMDNPSGGQDRTYLLLEDFDDFAVVDGLTLPRRYKLSLDIQEQNFTFLADWSFAFSQILHNQQQLTPKLFSNP